MPREEEPARPRRLGRPQGPRGPGGPKTLGKLAFLAIGALKTLGKLRSLAIEALKTHKKEFFRYRGGLISHGGVVATQRVILLAE